MLVDGAQTAGHIPIDVRASGVDFYAIPSHKWLCGPDGLGALYVREDLIPLVAPTKVSGRAAAEYDLEGGFEPEREKITKYELTTTATALIAGTIEAAEWYLESGPEAVFERTRELNRYADERFSRIDGVEVVSPHHDATRTGLFCFTVDGVEAADVNAFLQQEGRVVCRSGRAVQQRPALAARLQHRGRDRPDRRDGGARHPRGHPRRRRARDPAAAHGRRRRAVAPARRGAGWTTRRLSGRRGRPGGGSRCRSL